LHVVLYEFETWSLAVREEHRLRMCENPALRIMFGFKTGSKRRAEGNA
jgi:hypothetical protein